MSHAQGEVSPELDMLSCELLGDAFDRLADAQDVNVLLVTQNGSGEVTPYEFAEDGHCKTLTKTIDAVKFLRLFFQHVLFRAR